MPGATPPDVGGITPACDLENATPETSCELELPSCRGANLACGDLSESCCTSTLLPGDEYLRSYDGSETVLQDGLPVVGFQARTTTPASIEPFWLDRFEVTVGRFRKFVANYDAWRKNKPFEDDGNLFDRNGTGWNRAIMNPSLPIDGEALRSVLNNPRCGDQPAWTAEPADKEDYPITCITWFVAYAFCIWDGGRLPTEAEWNYAAAGGAQQRAFPWSDPASDASTPAPSQANLQGSELRPVGKGAGGRWSHQDLAGNAFEWSRDHCTDCPTPPNTGPDLDTYSTASCNHCVELEGPNQILRGGSFKFQYVAGRTAFRAANAPRNGYDDIGFRCARNPL
jgi:sulfatase modifying factor 1